MRMSIRPVLAALLAAFVVAAASGGATASKSLSIEGTTTLSSNGRMTFAAEGAEVICSVTLVKTLIGDLPKLEGTSIGRVTDIRTASCRSSTETFRSATFLGLTTAELWRLTYRSFTGTLPNITGVIFRVSNLQALFETSILGIAIGCLYEGSLLLTQALNETGLMTNLRAGESEIALRTTLRGFGCPMRYMIRAEFTPLQRASLILLSQPPPPIWIVSVGDSYISGEGSRWAGNTNREPTRIDALGRTAYFDNPERTAETIERCHRSNEPEIRIGGAGVTAVNFACSGATVATTAGPPFKPGLDRVANSQLELLRDLATRHPRQIKLVAVSIGGNDFGFREIVEACIQAYVAEGRRLCSTEMAVTERVNAANVTAKTALIARAILEVRETMRNAGSADGEYRIVVQNYESPVPTGPGFRYTQEEEEGTGRRKKRATVGKCGFWDADAEWANATALVQINRAVADAVTATGLPNVVPLKLETAFEGRRLCERGVDLIENTELALGTEAGGADRLEWINQLRVPLFEYFIQESLHPNYWAVLALRNCLRRTYVGGRAAATCTRNGAGLEGGEPRMQIR